MNSKTILIIEDDLGILKSLKLYLENSGFDVLTYSSGDKAVEKIIDLNPDLVILDLNLPEKDGTEICKEVRQQSNLPIIMLTARNSDLDKIIGLEIGADDYIEKPFSPRILLARINSILRRFSDDKILEEKKDDNSLNIGPFSLNKKKFSLTKNGEEIKLTKNEFDLMKNLMKNNGEVVDREDLMKDIGYNEYAFDRTIDTHIKNLRKKLGNKEIILTIRGEGYRLNV